MTQRTTANPAAPLAPRAAFDSVPLLDLHRQYSQIREEVLEAIERVCSSQQFILGTEVEALEREIEKRGEGRDEFALDHLGGGGPARAQ